MTVTKPNFTELCKISAFQTSFSTTLSDNDVKVTLNLVTQGVLNFSYWLFEILHSKQVFFSDEVEYTHLLEEDVWGRSRTRLCSDPWMEQSKIVLADGDDWSDILFINITKTGISTRKCSLNFNNIILEHPVYKAASHRSRGRILTSAGPHDYLGLGSWAIASPEY